MRFGIKMVAYDIVQVTIIAFVGEFESKTLIEMLAVA